MATVEPIELEFNEFTSFFDSNSYSVRVYTGTNRRERKESYKETRGRFVEEALIRIQSNTCENREEVGKIKDKINVIKDIKYTWVCLDCAKNIGREDEYHSRTKSKTESCNICKNTFSVAEVHVPSWYETCLTYYSNKDITLLYSILDKYYGEDLEPFDTIFGKNTVEHNEKMVIEVQEKIFTELPYYEYLKCKSVRELFVRIKEYKKVSFNRYTALTAYRKD